MEIKGRGYSFNHEMITRSLVRVYYDDIYYVKKPANSTTYTIKSRVRNSFQNGIGGVHVNVKLGNNVRISTNGSSRNRSKNSTTSIDIKVQQDEVQPINDILMSCIPNVQVEERTIRYSEANKGKIAISLLLIVAAIVLYFCAYFGVKLPEILQNPVVLFGVAGGLTLLLNIFGMVTMDRSQMIKIYRGPGGSYRY